jgi:exodeoxyribonuclease V gamma subunit
MPGLIQHTSNQLDLLAQQLVKVVSTPLSSPFTPEMVVVQSLATRRWLSFQIAQDQKICANYYFPTLAEFVTKLIQQGAPGGDAERMPFESLIWNIDALLRKSLEKKEFVAVAHYLRDGDPLKRFHLAIRLANLFDQYGAYRPEKLSSWATSRQKRSGDEAWQATLWRELDQTPAFAHTLQRLRSQGFRDTANFDLPERISIFAPASVPPAYLDLLFQLSHVRNIHLFLLSPSREYRGTDRTPKQRARRGLSSSDSTAGNPLTTSWGRLDADLTDLLIEKQERFDTGIITGSEQFREFETETLLGTLKNDILTSQNRGVADEDDPGAVSKATVSPGDHSLSLHACYSPMREVEALYDQLLACLESMPDLRPRDILVMTPSIEQYAPFIRAVFNYPEDESIRIPYSLTDRHPRSESQTIDTFLSLLQMPGSRYTASQVFGLLSSRSLRRRFHFRDEDLSLIRDWIDQTTIRWGIDGEQRKRLGLPELNANTWRQGLQRLLLGYATKGSNRVLFDGILPHDEVEGEGANILGRFISAAEALFALTEKLEQARPLTDWGKPLTEMIDQFFDPVGEEEVRDVRFLRFVIDQLRTLRGESDTNETVDFAVLRQYLEGQVATMEQRGRFFSAGVTFCALKPVRGVPARVVCLLGINDQAFPRRPEPGQFDLMAQKPETGDPSVRQDDRYSFLQAVLAAKERLIISYVGRSTIHNQRIPPSVVVSELLDYTDQAFEFSGKKSAREFLLTEHPLQAFSPRYFTEPREDKRLFGFSEANAAASRIVASGSPVEFRPFLTEPLPPPDEPLRNIELHELIRFWKHPSEYFLRQRLGLNLRDRGFCLDDDEPFQPTPLELYQLRQDLLTQELDRETLPFEVFQARGLLPPGEIGRLQFESIHAEIRKLAEKVRDKIGAGKKDLPISIDLILPEYTLTGTIENVYGGNNVHFRPANLATKDYLRAWIEHLVLSVHQAGDQPIQTKLIGRNGARTFGEIPYAREQLLVLCDLFIEGQSQPIPFLPRASMAFAEATVFRQGDPTKKARDEWDPWGRDGEKSDPALRHCFKGLDPLADPFSEIALKVLQTMLRRMAAEEL